MMTGSIESVLKRCDTYYNNGQIVKLSPASIFL